MKFTNVRKQKMKSYYVKTEGDDFSAGSLFQQNFNKKQLLLNEYNETEWKNYPQS